MRLYIGNLSPRVTDAELKAAFLDYGDVRSASVVFDRDTGRSRGFGFVELTTSSPIDDMQEIELEGKRITVEISTGSKDLEAHAL